MTHLCSAVITIFSETCTVLPFIFELFRAHISPRRIGPNAARRIGSSISVPSTADISSFTSLSVGTYRFGRFFCGSLVFNANSGRSSFRTALISPCVFRTVFGECFFASSFTSLCIMSCVISDICTGMRDCISFFRIRL